MPFRKGYTAAFKRYVVSYNDDTAIIASFIQMLSGKTTKSTYKIIETNQ